MHSTPSAPAAIAARAPRTWPSISAAMSSSSIARRPSGPPGARPAAGRPALGAARERVGVRAQVIELRDEHGAVLVHGVDDAPQRGHEALVVVAVVLRRHAGVREHGQRLHHDQPGAARGACRVVVARALTRNVVLSKRDRVRGEDDPARQPPAAKFERRRAAAGSECSRRSRTFLRRRPADHTLTSFLPDRTRSAILARVKQSARPNGPCAPA